MGRTLAWLGQNLGGCGLEAPMFFKPKFIAIALRKDMIDVFPQAADMSQPAARTAVRAVGASTGAGQWPCQAAA